MGAADHRSWLRDVTMFLPMTKLVRVGKKKRPSSKIRNANKDNKAENVRALASAQTQLAAHHTEDEDTDFSESELPAIAQKGGIVTALTKQEPTDTHDKLVNELDDQVWEPVKMGPKLEDAIINPKNPFPNQSNSNMWSGLTKVSPKKSKPFKSDYCVTACH